MATQSEFIAAADKQNGDYNAAYSLLYGKLTAIQLVGASLETMAAQVKGWRDEIVGIGGGTGGTGGTTPTPSGTIANQILAKIKAKAAAAPTTVASLQRTTAVTYTYGAQNAAPTGIPGAGGNYQRRMFQRAANTGGGGLDDLFAVSYQPGRGIMTPAVGGLAKFECDDGTQSVYYAGEGGVGGVTFGFKHTGRALALCNRIRNYVVVVYVDGKIAPVMEFPTNDSYGYIDFGTSGTRKIIVKAEGEFAEIATFPGDVIEPYNFLDDLGGLKGSYMGDSWGQTTDYTDTHMALPAVMGLMMGAGYVGGSTIGGTGYSATQGQPNGTDERRLTLFTSDTPDFAILALGINDHPDNFPTFASDVAYVMAQTRQRLPNALMVVITLVSAGSRATNLSGSEARKRDIIVAEAKRQGGNVMTLDGYNGDYWTSKGTSGSVFDTSVITGEGSAETPANDGGNADQFIDNNGGRHLTPPGVRYTAEYFGRLFRTAVATMPTT